MDYPTLPVCLPHLPLPLAAQTEISFTRFSWLSEMRLHAARAD